MRFERQYVLLACQPKSGSTFLSACLSHALNIRRVGLVPGWDYREQELSRSLIKRQIRRSWRRGFISQQHVRYSGHTERLLNTYKIKPLVQVRNLRDALASIRDHMRNEDHKFSMAYFDQHHVDLPDNELELMLAKLALPWYLNFYKSWRNCPNAIWISYEKLIKSPEHSIMEICERLGRPITEEKAASSVLKANGENTRYNFAKSGRGGRLSSDVNAAIDDLLSLYPECHKDEYFTSMMQEAS